MVVVFEWTEERNNRLTALYRDGLSFTLIAAKLGCSRNAAIGRAHRMKLAAREPTTVIEKIARKVVRTMSAPPVIVKAIPVRRPIVPLSRVTGHECEITELTDRSCRFPMWAHDEPHGFDRREYCGAPEADLYGGKPYCHYHARVCSPERQ